MKEYSVTVHDKDGDIVLTREDLLKYTTKENIIASALMIRLCQFAFNKLSPQNPVCPRELYWQIGFPGPGILDCIEMVSHAVREGRCLQNPTLSLSHSNAEPPTSLVGYFLFEITYHNRTIVIWPDKSVFDDEFRFQVATWQTTEECERYNAYLEYKKKKVEQIMSMPDEVLLHFSWK